jgi:hypothetical protein
MEHFKKIKIGKIFIKKFRANEFHLNIRFLITKYYLKVYHPMKNLIKIINVTFAINVLTIFLRIYFSIAKN